jgi:uncharacterized protein with predicted RNA binding PUA domain
VQDDLRRIRTVADYQFGKGVGAVLFPENVDITHSRRTGRIRYVHLDGARLATMRPTDGLFTLSILGAKRTARSDLAKCLVTVESDVAGFVADGSDVFAMHIAKTHDEIRPKDEVIVVDADGRVLAVGRAILSSEEMCSFKRGVAVKVRHACGTVS